MLDGTVGVSEAKGGCLLGSQEALLSLTDLSLAESSVEATNRVFDERGHFYRPSAVPQQVNTQSRRKRGPTLSSSRTPASGGETPKSCRWQETTAANSQAQQRLAGAIAVSPDHNGKSMSTAS